MNKGNKGNGKNKRLRMIIGDIIIIILAYIFVTVFIPSKNKVETAENSTEIVETTQEAGDE